MFLCLHGNRQTKIQTAIFVQQLLIVLVVLIYLIFTGFYENRSLRSKNLKCQGKTKTHI